MFNKKNKNDFRKGSKLYISQKSYSNPYFRDANNNTKSSFSLSLSLKAKFIAFLIILFIITCFWFLFYSKFFLIHDLSINLNKGNDIGGISENDIEKIVREELRSRFIFLPGNNFFLFKNSKVYDRLNKQFAFENISVQKKFPNKLQINLKEVSYALIWKEENKYYYITTKGDIIKEVSPEEIKEIFPLIENKGVNLIPDNKIPEKDAHLQFAISLYRKFKDTNIFNIEKFVIGNQNDSTLTMKILEGPEVYFNVNNNIDSQSDKLLLLKNQKLKDDLYKKTYIDLRFGDMIYYR